MTKGNLEIIQNRELVQPTAGFEVLPKGKYAAYMASSELKQNKSGTGMVLHTVFKVTEAGYEGREIRHYYNVTNKNPQAQEIGQGQLSTTAKACGLPGIPADSSDMHDRALIISVTVKPGEGEYGPSNAINNWLPLQSTKPSGKAAVVDDDMPPF